MVGGCCLAGEVSANEGAEDRAGRPMGEGPERGWRSIAEGKLVSLSSSTRASGASSACSQCTCPKGPNAPNAQSQNAHSHSFPSFCEYLAKVNITAQTVEEWVSSFPTASAPKPLKIAKDSHPSCPSRNILPFLLTRCCLLIQANDKHTLYVCTYVLTTEVRSEISIPFSPPDSF